VCLTCIENFLGEDLLIPFSCSLMLESRSILSLKPWPLVPVVPFIDYERAFYERQEKYEKYKLADNISDICEIICNVCFYITRIRDVLYLTPKRPNISSSNSNTFSKHSFDSASLLITRHSRVLWLTFVVDVFKFLVA
jgi:hypothetical protein